MSILGHVPGAGSGTNSDKASPVTDPKANFQDPFFDKADSFCVSLVDPAGTTLWASSS